MAKCPTCGHDDAPRPVDVQVTVEGEAVARALMADLQRFLRKKSPPFPEVPEQ